uniref:LepA_C domain-containing protein n=1 Tax=Macrostomum lignano TaxID=282301 RepID=A0A1I8FJI8_9PLAT
SRRPVQLTLNDASVSVPRTRIRLWGRGWRLGFLGLLQHGRHSAAPGVEYNADLHSGSIVDVTSPSVMRQTRRWPSTLSRCERRGSILSQSYIDSDRILLEPALPLSEIVIDAGRRAENSAVPAMPASTTRRPAGRAASWQRAVVMATKLAEELPRQQFLIKKSGTDRTRRQKLLAAQREGKRRLRMVGNVEIPRDAFIKQAEDLGGWPKQLRICGALRPETEDLERLAQQTEDLREAGPSNLRIWLQAGPSQLWDLGGWPEHEAEGGCGGEQLAAQTEPAAPSGMYTWSRTIANKPRSKRRHISLRDHATDAGGPVWQLDSLQAGEQRRPAVVLQVFQVEQLATGVQCKAQAPAWKQCSTNTVNANQKHRRNRRDKIWRTGNSGGVRGLFLPQKLIHSDHRGAEEVASDGVVQVSASRVQLECRSQLMVVAKCGTAELPERQADGQPDSQVAEQRGCRNTD